MSSLFTKSLATTQVSHVFARHFPAAATAGVQRHRWAFSQIRSSSKLHVARPLHLKLPSSWDAMDVTNRVRPSAAEAALCLAARTMKMEVLEFLQHSKRIQFSTLPREEALRQLCLSIEGNGIPLAEWPFTWGSADSRVVTITAPSSRDAKHVSGLLRRQFPFLQHTKMNAQLEITLTTSSSAVSRSAYSQMEKAKMGILKAKEDAVNGLRGSQISRAEMLHVMEKLHGLCTVSFEQINSIMQNIGRVPDELEQEEYLNPEETSLEK